MESALFEAFFVLALFPLQLMQLILSLFLSVFEAAALGLNPLALI